MTLPTESTSLSPTRYDSTTTSTEASNQEAKTPPIPTNDTTNAISRTTTPISQTRPTPQSQNEEALYNYARSIVRATPKRKPEDERKRERQSKNSELEDESLALLLSWGGGEKKMESEAVVDAVCDEDGSGREGDGLGEDGGLGKDGGLGGDVGRRTWESPQLDRILAVLVICVLVVSLLLLWQGVLSILASVRRE